MGFDKRPAGAGNGEVTFFAKNYTEAYALLIEIRSLAPQTPGYKGRLTDAVYADVTAFKTEADLAEGGKPEVLRNARIDATLLARELTKIYEDDEVTETVRVIGQWKGTRSDTASWVFRFPPESVREQVIEWYERREAARAEDTPDFLK